LTTRGGNPKLKGAVGVGRASHEVALVSPALHPTRLSLGERLRRRRKEMGLTLADVARESGLTAGFLSLVERDLATPSIASISGIAAVLSATMGEFLDDPPRPEPLTRRNTRQVYAVATGGLRYERLSNAFDGSQLRSVIIHEPPGHRSEPVAHPGEELVYVLSGALVVEIEGATTLLATGDSIHFSSQRIHATWNPGAEPAVLLWCGTMDIFGEGAAPSIANRAAAPALNEAPAHV
jgi:transcriptional regulator with XRE-family HTH domain